MKKTKEISKIKKIVLLSGLRVFTQSLNQGAVWFETYTNYSSPPSPYGYNSCGRKYLDGDTVINNMVYKKLYHEELDIYCTNNILSGPTYYGAIRDDISEQKAWLIFPEKTEEWLYFDFSLSIGDTVPGFSQFSMSLFSYLTVTDIDTITTLDGIDRRRWLFDEDPYCEESSMIEGIGCSSGFLAPHEVIFEYWNYLRSFKIDTSLIYCLEYGCEIPTDTCTTVGFEPTINDLPITIFPNPVLVNKPFRVSGIPIVINDPFVAEMYDVRGIKLASFNILNSDLTINALEKPGIYFLIIFNSKSKKQFKICAL